MESKADYIKKLKTELSEVGSEIEKLIVRSDKVAVEIKQGYDEFETALRAKQSSTEAKLRESLMSADEVWDLVWANVWDAVKELNCKAATNIEQDYKDMEPALQAKQSVLQLQLQETIVSSDEVWDEIWNEVWSEFWSVVEAVERKAAIEIKQLGDELEVLEVKRSALRTRLHEVLISGDEVWNVVKDVSHAIVE